MSDAESEKEDKYSKCLRKSKKVKDTMTQQSHLTDTVKLNKKEEPKKKKKIKESQLPADCQAQQSPENKNKKKKNKKEEEPEVILKEDQAEDNNAVEKQPKGGKKEKKGEVKTKYTQADYDTLIAYMKDSNKPYNGTTLESNLKGSTGFKKGGIELALNQAVTEGIIIKKAYGSSMIFWYNQDNLPGVSKEEIQMLSETILQKQSDLAQANQSLRIVTAQLAKIMQSKTDEQLKIEIVKLEKKLEDQDKQLSFYQSESFQPEDPQNVAVYEEKLSKIEGVYKKRRRTCEDAIKEMIENSEETKTLAQMFELMGIDNE